MPALSSLVIADKKHGPGWDVILVAEPDDERLACDGCEGVEIPLCVEHCKESDDLWKILQTFLEKREKDIEDPQADGAHQSHSIGKGSKSSDT